jgi:hypothetical protein
LDEPTFRQLQQLYRLSHLLTNIFLKPVTLVRIDRRNGDLVILSGEEIDVSIDKQGNVSYDQTGFQNDE